MKIERFEAVDRCLFWKEKKILVVGDLHLGYENYLNEMGWVFPKTQMEETMEVFDKIFDKVKKVEKIILLGDVKHYFAGILNKEFADFYKIVEMFRKNLVDGGEIIIVKGNHDNILEPIVCQDRFEGFVFLKDYFVINDVLFFHGDKRGFEKLQLELCDKKIQMIIVGHLHPAIKIDDGEKVEKFKCFCLGKYEEKMRIIVPSFFPLEEGTDVQMLLSEGEFNKNYKIKELEIFVVIGDGGILKWGKVDGKTPAP